jgi:hypothetical protein
LKSQKQQREKTDQEKSLDNEGIKMTSSIASILDDTPSDSGIQTMSSMTSSMLSSAGFDYDTVERNDQLTMDTTITETNNNPNVEPDSEDTKIPEELMTSITSTFDTENTEIVYRRKIKKNNTRQAPKKRVSFHEDILKNTKTDNIHIEHGFITYKQQSKSGIIPHHKNGRYSWCSEFDQENYISNDNENGYDNNEDTGGGSKLYRNACSDVLDYGRYEENNVSDGIKMKSNAAASNVLEYGKKATDKKGEFYTCNCSSSNSSLDSSGSSGAGSEENNGNTNNNNNNNKSDNANGVDPNGANKRNYQQAKSNSCDCIGENNNNVSL